jgi:PPOX class probable F420-dependent enzyme
MSFPKTKPIPKSHHDILTNRATGHICTIRPDGRLTVNPVGLMFDGEYVRVSTVKTRMKYKNLVRDPRVAISIPHRNNPNRYVEIRGIAELTDDPDRTFAKQILEAFPEGLNLTIKRLTAEEDRVAIEAESHARHVSGKPYDNQYHILMRLRDGKIVEWREYMDTMLANAVLCGQG